MPVAVGVGLSVAAVILVTMGTVMIVLVGLVVYYRRKIKKSTTTEVTPQYEIVPPPLPHPRVQLGENVAYHHTAMASHTGKEDSGYENVDLHKSTATECKVPMVANAAYGKYRAALS